MTKPTKPRESANNAFIGACLRIDAALKRISEARENHFGVDAEQARRWDEAGSAQTVAFRLEELADWIEGKAQ